MVRRPDAPVACWRLRSRRSIFSAAWQGITL